MSRAEIRVLSAKFLPSLSTWVMEVEVVQGQVEAGQRFVEHGTTGIALEVLSVALGDQRRPGGQVLTLQVARDGDRLGELTGRHLLLLKEQL